MRSQLVSVQYKNRATKLHTPSCSLIHHQRASRWLFQNQVKHNTLPFNYEQYQTHSTRQRRNQSRTSTHSLVTRQKKILSSFYSNLKFEIIVDSVELTVIVIALLVKSILELKRKFDLGRIRTGDLSIDNV